MSAQQLEVAAELLGSIVEEVVFVGGATVHLWLSEPAAPAARATEDVDVICEVTTPVLLVATKLSAWKGRGGGDLLRSLDVHDVFVLFDGRPELTDELAATPPTLRTYIQDGLTELCAEPYFDYAVEGATASYGPLGGERARIVQGRLEVARSGSVGHGVEARRSVRPDQRSSNRCKFTSDWGPRPDGWSGKPAQARTRLPWSRVAEGRLGDSGADLGCRHPECFQGV